MEDSSRPSFVSSSSIEHKVFNSKDAEDREGEQATLADLLSRSESSSPEPRPKKQMVSVESMDKESDDYLKKRARNNLAVRKSRDRSKKRIMETQERVEQLTRENDELNQKVTLLSKELSVLRALFTNGGFTVPCNLQIVAQNPSVVPDSGREDSITKTYSQANTKVASPSSNSNNHTSVIRTASANSRPCHGVILVSEPGKMNLDIQAGINFKSERQ